MIETDDIYRDEELLYKPKAKKKKRTKKSDHKHVYENCVFEIHHYDFSKPIMTIGTYCPVCGKIGDVKDCRNPKWYMPPYKLAALTETEKARAEFDESTRMLPFFVLGDYFQKEV